MNEEIIYKQSIYRLMYPGDKDVIDKHNKHILEFDKGRVISNIGGYQSHDITFGYSDLIEYIKKALSTFELEMVFRNMWINVNKGTDYNLPHVHELNGVSAVYYHKMCCDKAPIIFQDVMPEVRQWKYEVTPKEGEILLFDSFIPHSVRGCGNPDHQRISIAFNFTKL
jgi:hypothetical protein